MKHHHHQECNSKIVSIIVHCFVFVTVALLVVMGIYGALEPVNEPVFSKGNSGHATAIIARRLLTLTTTDYGDGNGNGDGSTNRIGAQCTKDNILVFQGVTSPLPNGTPTYTVEIQNVCLSGSCSISDIHVSCGWFSSARLINPSIFRRVDYDDCIVNNGEPLNPGEALSFQYANTFKYPLSVSSVAC